MFAIVGLGNPGARYAKNRHNAGFRVIERLVARAAVSTPGQSFNWEKKFGCCFVQAKLANTASLLVMPQTYMNRSGEACVPLLHYFRVEKDQLIVVHDDLDLEPGVLRIRRGGSAGGHRGLENMMLHWNRDDFIRVRIGIGHPCRKAHSELSPEVDAEREALSFLSHEEAVTRWVLGNAVGIQQEEIEKTLNDAAEAICELISGGLESAQRRFNRVNKRLPEKGPV